MPAPTWYTARSLPSFSTWVVITTVLPASRPAFTVS